MRWRSSGTYVLERQRGVPTGRLTWHDGRGTGSALLADAPHRVREKGAVQLVADRRDVPGLLRAEQVARPADLQVPHGDAEPGAQVGVLLDGADASLGVVRQRAGRHHEVAVRATSP